MSISLRQFARTHRSPAFPLLAIQNAIRRHGGLDHEGLLELSRELKLPVSAVRSTASFYADLQSGAAGVRVCAGTSCQLVGGASHFMRWNAAQPCQKVHCLGHCHQSPAVMRPDGQVVSGCQEESVDRILGAMPEPAVEPDIRCEAAEPIVTRHLLGADLSTLEAARAEGVYAALERARENHPTDLLDAVEQSGERGRGGAAYPTGLKWRSCAESEGPDKYVIANGDEGDPGSFVDRVLMERDPHSILEGMALCAMATGASKGLIYIRSEYPRAATKMRLAIEEAIDDGILGEFDVQVIPGMGSYVCGEETAMLNAIEGLRGEVRLRPPYPTESGLYGCPTVVDNVETLVNIPWILNHGADRYRGIGTVGSSGTKAICLNRGFARPGIVEVAFGVPLRRVIEQFGGGGWQDELEAVLVGGPMGSVLRPDEWDVPVCYDQMRARRIQLGHGGLVAVPKGTDPHQLLLHWLRFMRDESCGKCMPCRVGSEQAYQRASSMEGAAGRGALRDLLDVVQQTSLCAFGREIPRAVLELLDKLDGEGQS